MINVDDEPFERYGSTSEVDGRSVQGDRIDSSVTSVVHPGYVTYYVTRERISKTTEQEPPMRHWRLRINNKI
jgi:hypothetical protein